MDYTIEMQELSKTFNGVVAVNSLDLKVPKNCIFGFLGPNGAGKTTTIRLLLGLLSPTAGSARVLGLDSRFHPDELRACTGALLEHTGIYEQLSAEDNLAFYGRAFRMPDDQRRMRIKELLTRMGLWERRRDRAGTWSRGMKQKLALARTLLHRPALVLLDEPTAGLDVQSAVAIRKDLETLAYHEDVTIFLTTHNMAEAEALCQQVAVIRGGRLVAVGSPDDLRSQVGNQHIEITGRGFTPQAIQIISSFPQVRDIEAKNNHLVVNLLAEMDVAPLVTSLVGSGAQVEGVRRKTASLEEVFLTLTGEQDD